MAPQPGETQPASLVLTADYFVFWATGLKCDPLQASLPLLAEFREYVFNDRNISVRTVKNYRLAIAYYWKSIRGCEILENNQVLSDLFRGFKRERPTPSIHVVQWDILLVLISPTS